MRVKDLSGNYIKWILKGDNLSQAQNKKKSKLHTTARKIIHDLFSTMQILEEVPVSLKPGTTQFFDFYINQIKLVIEVHGEQHYKFSSLFHSSARDFLNQKKRDNEKKEWCQINGISYIELPYNESEEEWKKKILHR